MKPYLICNKMLKHRKNIMFSIRMFGFNWEKEYLCIRF